MTITQVQLDARGCAVATLSGGDELVSDAVLVSIGLMLR